MMEHLKVIGFGFFGKPETVLRVFEKTVENYTVSYEIPRLSSFETESALYRINGFSLGFDEKALNLSIFTADADHNRRTYKHLVPIRKNRLN